MTSIMIVSATRRTEQAFWEGSALGASLRRLSFDARIGGRIAYQNQRSLPDVYNQAIDESEGSDVLVFVHDDVWLDDCFLADRLEDAMHRYDVVGVAGNRRRQPRQPAWAFADATLAWDDRQHLSGAVAHGDYPFGALSHFGHLPADCELLDGVFLAANRARLVGENVRFDPRFAFHFYDMDFCRAARQAGLALGTWPISLTHQSGGAFGSEPWKHGYDRYIAKWGD
jgi:GT2 family glycosyltransferase